MGEVKSAGTKSLRRTPPHFFGPRVPFTVWTLFARVSLRDIEGDSRAVLVGRAVAQSLFQLR